MTVLPEAVAIIQGCESCRLTAYLDGNGIWTIGWGHTGPEVVDGLAITQEHADAMFAADLAHFDVGVTRICTETTAHQRGAMVSLAYNIGLGNFAKSSVAKYHNAGEFSAAATAFGLWNKVAGQVSRGLVDRRAAEAALYKSEGVAS